MACSRSPSLEAAGLASASSVAWSATCSTTSWSPKSRLPSCEPNTSSTASLSRSTMALSHCLVTRLRAFVTSLSFLPRSRASHWTRCNCSSPLAILPRLRRSYWPQNGLAMPQKRSSTWNVAGNWHVGSCRLWLRKPRRFRSSSRAARVHCGRRLGSDSSGGGRSLSVRDSSLIQ